MKSLVSKGCAGLVLGGLALSPLWAAAPARAASSTYEVINGGECLPYPSYNAATSTYSAISYEHFLEGFNGATFCHLRMTQDWPVTTLEYVLYNASVPHGTLTARLCVHTGMSYVATCGAPSTIPPTAGEGGGFYANYASPPSPLPADAAGAYLQLTFPSNQVTGVFEVLPVWYNPSAATAAGPTAQAPPRPDAQRPRPEQQVALMGAARSRETEHVTGLASAVRNERRDDVWAQQAEAGLRDSYASARLAAGGLKSVDCRSAKCEIRVQLEATTSTQAAIDQQGAITRWISTGTPCGYTMVPGQDPAATAASVTLVYLACGK